MSHQSLLIILLASILTNNVVFMRFLGICPYMGVSKSLSSAFGMAAAVLFVMTLSTLITYPVHKLVLEPYKMEYLQTIAFILVIGSLVQLTEIVMKKVAPVLYKSLGIYLPLITTNCAILGIAILNIREALSLVQALVFTIGSALGFGLALFIFASLRERFEQRHIPKVLQGTPIALITAGILALAFLGFAGLGMHKPG